MKIKTILFVFASTLSFSVFASPHGYNSRFNDPQDNRQERIDQGVRSGKLTEREVRRLERGEARIQYLKRSARADGVVTPLERARIREAEREQSRKIFNKKHNHRREY